MAQIIKKNEIASVLEVNAQNQLDVKIDASGNVTLTKSAAGLKAEVVIPEAQEAPVAVNGARIEGNTLKFAKTDGGAEIEVQLPAAPVDVKLQGLAFEGGKLKATLSDAQVVEVDFTAKLVVDAFMAVQEPEKAQLKGFIRDLIKGEELQGLDGQTIGYVIAQA